MNIDKIEVSENNIYFVIYPKKKEVVINGETSIIEEEKINELIRIVRTWNHEYYDSGYTDGNRFEVIIHYNGKEDVMRGVRGLPENYESFSSLVRSIYGRR